MQAALLLMAPGLGPNERFSTPSLSLENRERHGWGSLSSKLGELGPPTP